MDYSDILRELLEEAREKHWCNICKNYQLRFSNMRFGILYGYCTKKNIYVDDLKNQSCWEDTDGREIFSE